MAVKHVSVTEAHALQQEGAVYIDVRSTDEYLSGHPAGALSVPLLDADPDTGQMMPNPDFVQVMQANFPSDAKLLIGCQVGGRSQRAAQMLDAFGFTDVSNVRGGYAGLRDRMSGRMVEPGWAESGLPEESDAPTGRTYADLLAKVDASR